MFVQISDENVHHVRELMDEVFGTEQFCAVVTVQQRPEAQADALLASVADYLLWYAKDKSRVKYHPLFLPKERGGTGSGEYSWVELPDGERRRLTKEESDNTGMLTERARFFIPDNLTSADISSTGTLRVSNTTGVLLSRRVAIGKLRKRVWIDSASENRLSHSRRSLLGTSGISTIFR